MVCDVCVVREGGGERREGKRRGMRKTIMILIAISYTEFLKMASYITVYGTVGIVSTESHLPV